MMQSNQSKPDPVRDTYLTRIAVEKIADNSIVIANALTSIASNFAHFIAYFVPTVVGIEVVPGHATTHEVNKMSKLSVTVVKADPKVKTAAPPIKDNVTPVAFQLLDNGDLTFTVFGVDAAGARVDISNVATLAATSDTPAVVTVDTPNGMSSTIHAASPPPTAGQTANITLVATWKDASVGPFTITWPINITPGAVTGIQVVPGTPTVH